MPMSICLFTAATFSAALAVSLPARALPASARSPTVPAASRTTWTADYVAQTVGSDEVVTFTGDELAVPPAGAYGDLIRRPPGVIRIALIRPRMNFVCELLKSIENL